MAQARKQHQDGTPGHDQGSLNNQGSQQGIVSDQRGQDQPVDRDRAQQTSGQKAQKDAAQSRPQSPGQPAGGE